MGRILLIKPPLCSVCGTPLGSGSHGDKCDECGSNPPAFDYARSAAVYEGVIKDAIHHFKFNGKERLVETLAGLILNMLEKDGIMNKGDLVLVPVPLSRARKRERGYNQSEILARYISERTAIPVDTSLLKKTRNARPQSELDRRERLVNLKGAFRAEGSSGLNVLLIDDIYTTGSTVREAAYALKADGAASVVVATVARAVLVEV